MQQSTWRRQFGVINLLSRQQAAALSIAAGCHQVADELAVGCSALKLLTDADSPVLGVSSVQSLL